MMSIKIKTDLSKFLDSVRFDIKDTDRKVEAALNAAGRVINDWLKSTNPSFGTQPGWTPGDGERIAHPGAWADRRGQLNKGQHFRVFKRGTAWVLRFWNNTEYAAALDAKEGYFVLSGVIDKPGDPGLVLLEKALRRALPDWKIRFE